MSPLTIAATYAVVGTAIIPIGLEWFEARYKFLDVVLASVAGGLFSLIPVIGGLSLEGIASLVATVGVLYWRMRSDLYPDIIFSVFAARLVMVPVFLWLDHPGS